MGKRPHAAMELGHSVQLDSYIDLSLQPRLGRHCIMRTSCRHSRKENKWKSDTHKAAHLFFIDNNEVPCLLIN